MAEKSCVRCFEKTREFVPAMWIDPEQDALCNPCRIELGWEEGDCRRIGEPQPAPVALTRDEAKALGVPERAPKKGRRGQQKNGTPWRGMGSLAGPKTAPVLPGDKPLDEQVRDWNSYAARVHARYAAPAAESVGPKENNEEGVMEERVCSHAGCDVVLKSTNKSGRCTKHWYVPKSEASGESRARGAKRVKSAKKSNGNGHAATAKVDVAGVATICVTSENLDRFWSRLTLEEKANLFQLQLDARPADASA